MPEFAIRLEDRIATRDGRDFEVAAFARDEVMLRHVDKPARVNWVPIAWLGRQVDVVTRDGTEVARSRWLRRLRLERGSWQPTVDHGSDQ